MPETDYRGKLRRGALVVFNVTAVLGCCAVLCVLYLVLPGPARVSPRSTEQYLDAADYAFILSALPATAAVAFAFVAVASLLARRPRGGPTAAIVASAFALVLSVIGDSDFLEHLGRRPWSAVLVFAAALFNNFIVRALASLVFGLGVAALFETRPAPRSARVAWLVRNPVRIGIAVGLLSFGVHAVAAPPSALQLAKARLRQEYACAFLDDSRTRCGAIFALAVDAGGRRIAELHGSRPKELAVGMWTVGTPRRSWERDTSSFPGVPNGEFLLALSPDGSRVVVRGPSGITLLDGASGLPIGELAPCGGTDRWAVFAFTPDSRSLVVASDRVCQYSSLTGVAERALVATTTSDPPQSIAEIAFSSDGATLWIDRHGHLEGWRLATGVKAVDVEIGDGGFTFASSHDSQRLFGINGFYSEVWVWSARDGALLARFTPRSRRSPFTARTHSFAVLPDDRHLLVGNDMGYAVIDTETHDMRDVQQGGSMSSGRVGASADGTMIALGAASNDSVGPTLLVVRSDAVLAGSSP